MDLQIVKKQSEDILCKLKKSLKDTIPEMKEKNRIVVVTCGSYARRDATSGSDLDFFIIALSSRCDKKKLKHISRKIGETLKQEGIKLPSKRGAFNQIIKKENLLKNIGGNYDGNQHITRRILCLLEGEALYSKEDFMTLRKEIIEKYVRGTKNNQHLARYLLNDIIRYWRTVTVDYAFKADRDEKGWAIRNIKLIYSRKLLYTSGLFSVAHTIKLPQDEKISLLTELFSMSPLERIEYVYDKCLKKSHEEKYNEAKGHFNEVQSLYASFLSKMNNEKARTCLEGLNHEQRNDTIFLELKENGKIFGQSLYKLFLSTFSEEHEIREAVIF